MKSKIAAKTIKKANTESKNTSNLPQLINMKRVYTTAAQNTRSKIKKLREEKEKTLRKSKYESENILESVEEDIVTESESELNTNNDDSDKEKDDDDTDDDMLSLDSETQRKVDEERKYGKLIGSLEILRAMNALIPEQFNYLKNYYILKASEFSNHFTLEVDNLELKKY